MLVGPPSGMQHRSPQPVHQAWPFSKSIVSSMPSPGTTGRGSTADRVLILHRLLARATQGEQSFLTRLMMGELRQGALEGVMVEAVAKASGIPARAVRRAVMFSGDLGAVVQVALSEGAVGLGAHRYPALPSHQTDAGTDRRICIGGARAFGNRCVRVQVGRCSGSGSQAGRGRSDLHTPFERCHGCSSRDWRDGARIARGGDHSRRGDTGATLGRLAAAVSNNDAKVRGAGSMSRRCAKNSLSRHFSSIVCT